MLSVNVKSDYPLWSELGRGRRAGDRERGREGGRKREGEREGERGWLEERFRWEGGVKIAMC